MSTATKLWIGFGTLVAVLVLSSLLIILRVRSIENLATQMADVARPRSMAARELQINALGYALAVKRHVYNPEPAVFEDAMEKAAAVDRWIGEYHRLGGLTHQVSIEEQFNTHWVALFNEGQLLLAKGRGETQPQELERFHNLRTALEEFVENVMQDEATEEYVASRDAMLRDVRAIVGFALTLLLVGALIALSVSLATARAIVRSEAKVRSGRELLQVTLASIGDGVITTDNQGRVTFLNFVAEELTGWSNKDAAGQPLTEVFNIVNETTRETVDNPALRALEQGMIVGLANHTILIAKDGSERPIDDSAAPIRDEKRGVSGAVLVFRDITERKQMEQEVRDSEIRYRRLFQTAKDGILILDGETGCILDSNAFISALMGLEADQIMGRNLHGIGLLASEEDCGRAMEELKSGGYLRRDHLRIRNYRGEDVDVELVANAYGEEGRFVAQCNVRDISQRVAMERKILEQAESLAGESRRKDEFLAILSHELRNPLAPIRSAVHLLKLQEVADGDGVDPDVHKQAREVIERQVVNLTKLVSDLLEVSRVISGRVRLNLQITDIQQVIRHAVESVQPQIIDRAHRLNLTLGPDPVWANVDTTRMEEVLINLLNNAAKYTEDGGTIAVTCESDAAAQEIAICVQDTGMGLDEELIPRIFELFTQADRSLARSGGGLGVGLSLAHRLVSLHGGSIQAISPPPGCDQGSVFVVRLPLAPAPLQLQGTDGSARASVASGERKGRVLVVDDNVDQVLMVANALRIAGYEVRSAYTGTGGLNEALAWRPDVVLLDIGLPEMDGYEIARRLRSAPDTRGIRLFALTGYGREDDIALAREAGFDNHLTKPYELDELLKLIGAN